MVSSQRPGIRVLFECVLSQAIREFDFAVDNKRKIYVILIKLDPDW